MAARRKAGLKPRAVVAKAIDMGSSDASIFSGTLADSSAQHMPDAEQYWLIYKKHPWVRACVTLKANAVAAEGFDIVSDDDDAEGDDENPNVGLIHDYFKTAFIGRTNTFRKWSKAATIDLEVFDHSYLRKRKGGDALFLERLDPRMVHPKLNADKTEIESFILKRPGVNVSGDIAQAASDLTVVGNISGEPIPAEEVIMFSSDDGGDVVTGGPAKLESLDLTIAMDLNVRQHRNSFFRNGAQIGNAFINTSADEDQVRAAEKQLQAMKVGVRNAFRNLLLAGEWDIKALQEQGKNELDFIKGSELVRDEIAAVFNVPVSKLINVSGAMGQAGKGEDDEAFEEEGVLPIEENLYETLTVELLQKEFDIHDLRMVPKRRNKLRYDRINSAAMGVKAGMTGNEARAMIGLAKSDAPGMDVPLFVSATAGNVGQDEPVDPQVAQSEQLNSAENANQNEVAAKAKPRFPFGY